MRDARMPVMTSPQVVQLPRRPARRRRPSPRPAAAGGSPGRAWINGREVGGTEPRLDHLSIAHD
jgi:hypothetical protein